MATNSNYEYFDRELSWLSFNLRVLEEAGDKKLPIYERIKFLAIYSNNLEEFFKVRYASYRALLSLPPSNKQRIKYKPEEVMENIHKEVLRQQLIFSDLFYNQILPELEKLGLILYRDSDEIYPEHLDFLNDYFYHHVLPFMQVGLIAKGKILTFLQDNVIYLTMELIHKDKDGNRDTTREPRIALIKLPTSHISRFVELPPKDDKYYVMLLEDVIRLHLSIIFPGYFVDAAYSIKLTRDADLNIDDEFKGNLTEKIRKSVERRKTGNPARLTYDRTMPKTIIRALKEIFNLTKKDFAPADRYQGFVDLFSFPNPFKPKHEIEYNPKLNHVGFDAYPSLFRAIKDKDWMLHFPYHSYDYVIKFLNEAAFDEKVEEIKATQYRVASNSAVVSALINAANNGKKVTVFVEMKARFDEASNLYFADQMRKAGINIISSIPGLKVHAKVALVIRRPSKDGIRRGFAFLSTGNFNEKTAQIYADDGLFTADQRIIEELKKLFYFIENQSEKHFDFKHILVPRINLMTVFKQKIDNEIENAQKGKKAYILLKMNNLQEYEMIDKLYQASEAGVEIDLIIRGICCLIPGQPYSKNIKITRIVDMYLEHSRIFIFYNGGEYDTYFSSADWMRRNLLRRIESAVPVYDKTAKQELRHMLRLQLQDNQKAGWIDQKLNNVRKRPEAGEKKIRSQIAIYNYLKRKNNNYLKFLLDE